MLRRHFMTKAAYKPNIIIYYKADQMMPFLGSKEQRNNFNDMKFDVHFDHYNPTVIPNNIIFINESFNNGVGKLELYQKSRNDDNKYLMDPFLTIVREGGDSRKFSYIFGTNYQNDCIYELRIEGATIINISDMNNLNKVILPENTQYFCWNNIDSFYMGANTALKKLVIPPNIKTYNQWGNEFTNNHKFINKNNENIELIFTGNEVPKFSYHKNDVIKCPPNLVDKYKEYYPNAIASNNILYIKKVTQDTDKNIKFSKYNRNIDNELYVTKNYTNDGYTEINIINYDDFESNSSNVGVYSDNGGVGINGDYITEIILPESITKLTTNFLGKNVTKLTIPKNVTEISNYWNNFCILEENFVNLSSATIPYELRNCIIKNGKEENNCVINERNQLVFVRDTINRRIIIPDYVTEFYNNPLYNANIDYVFISKNITNTTMFAYTNCIIEVSEENEKYDSRDNCNAMIETATNTLVRGNSISTIPDSVEIIGQDAFSRVSFADNYILNLKNVKTIEDSAFSESGYSNILYIPKTLKRFYGDSFDKCYISKVSVDKENSIYNDYNDSNVVVETATNTLIFVANYGNNNIVIPNGIKIINSYAISQYYDADSIFIPKSVIELKTRIIGFCICPKDIIYEGTIEEWNNINKPSDWYQPYYIDSYTIHCSDGDIVINKS